MAEEQHGQASQHQDSTPAPAQEEQAVGSTEHSSTPKPSYNPVGHIPGAQETLEKGFTLPSPKAPDPGPKPTAPEEG